MARNPRQETIILAAGQTLPFPILGRWILILSNTAASVDVAFDNDAFSPMTAGVPYPASDGQYSVVRFRDTLGAGLTLVVIFSDDQCPDNRGSPLMAAIAASLVSVDAHLDAVEIPDTPAVFVLSVIAQTGVGSAQIVTAVAGQKKVLVQADHDNAGSIYLGFDVGVTAATAFARLTPGDSWQEQWAGDVFACSENGTEQARGYGLAN